MHSLEKYCIQPSKLLAIGVFTLCSGLAIAQDDDEYLVTDFTNSFDFQTLGGSVGRLAPHGNDLMGDMIDKTTGALSFQHTDVSIPGNSSLEVAFRRQLSQGLKISTPHQQAFGAWALDIPVAYFGFGVDIDDDNSDPEFTDGCMTKHPTAGTIIRSTVGGRVLFHPRTHETGTTLYVPGKGLSGFQSKVRTANNPGLIDPQADWVSGGQGSDYQGRCAEIAIAPDGTKYKFGRHTFRNAPPLAAPAENRRQGGNGFVTVTLSRRYAVYLITEVEDVHGNWVRYEYNANDELERIFSKDDREISIQYNNTKIFNSRLISSVNAHGRVWNYEYSDTSGLNKVVLPDGRYWDFAVGNGIRFMGAEVYALWNCVPSDLTVDMKHPDGAVGTFTLRETRHLKNATEPRIHEGEGPIFQATSVGPPTRTDVPACRRGQTTNSDAPPEGLPFYRVMSLVEKTINSPNIPAATWAFEYRGYSDGGPDDDWQNIENTWTKITEPDATERTYRYHTNGTDLGLLASIDIISASGAAERYDYDYDIIPLAHPECGFSSTEFGDALGTCFAYTKRPQAELKHLRDGVTYTTESTYNKNNGFFIDYGLPNTVTRYSSTNPSEKRITDTEYWHNAVANIIGRTERISHNDKEFTLNNYNSLGQVTSVNATGALWESYTYHADGNLNTITDPLGHSATLSNYYRGQPQNITLRDNTTISRTVNDNGWVISETNGRGYTTQYDYTAVGWMTSINRPSPWDDTFITYHNLGGSNFYRSATRGTKETVEWYDSMLRVIKVRENVRENASGSVTTYVKTDFDTLGRTIFTSLPSFESNPTRGTTTSYDGLGRVIQTRENFQPFVTTTTEYLANNKIRVTDPLGNRTTSTRSGYASPNDGQVTLIEQPESVNTSMTYNIYGNILTATQGNGVDSSTQRWSYHNDSLLLCRHHTPETGSTLYDYDARRQVQGFSEGNSGTTGCAALPNNRVTHTYDERQRLKTINYSNFTPGVTINYDANSNVISNVRGSTAWAYDYDSLDQITDETLNIDGRTYSLSYEYDAMSSLIRRTLPSGKEVNYTPNGLGQVTGVESEGVSYARGINYHANGLISFILYGNGQGFFQHLNGRQLPEHLWSFTATSIFALNLNYSYDARGNVVDIDDAVDPSRNRSMTYDDLGRLETAQGAWGSGSFNYDALGNLLEKQLGSRTVTVSYDAATNRTTQSADTAGSTRSIGYDSRGNVTTLGGLSFAYDMANQPVQVAGSSTGNYTYDGNFKRVKAVVDGKTIYNVYDASGSLVHIDDVTGSVASSTDYIRVNGMTIAQLKNGEPTYLHLDLLGSPVAATDARGIVAWQEHYTPYGEKWQQAAANDDQMGFTGHIADSATGLTYMQARYYDPVIGRFLSNDPVGFTGHIEKGNRAAHGFNRYAYANNNPYKYADPDGEFGLAGAAVGGGIGFIASVATQKFTGDGQVNWGTVAAATISGAAVGATGGLAAGAAAKVGLTGIEAGAAVAVPSAGVAYVGGATTQIVENLANDAPMEGVHQAGAVSAAGTVVGGVLGGSGTAALTNSNTMGAAGSLVGGKVTAEIITTVTQEAVTQTTSAVTSAVTSCSDNQTCN